MQRHTSTPVDEYTTLISCSVYRNIDHPGRRCVCTTGKVPLKLRTLVICKTASYAKLSCVLACEYPLLCGIQIVSKADKFHPFQIVSKADKFHFCIKLLLVVRLTLACFLVAHQFYRFWISCSSDAPCMTLDAEKHLFAMKCGCMHSSFHISLWCSSLLFFMFHGLNQFLETIETYISFTRSHIFTLLEALSPAHN